MARIAITESEIFAALRDADVETRPADAYTTAELGAALGLGETQTRKRLRELLAAGRAERLVVRLRGADGRVGPTILYRYIGAAT